MTEKLQWSLSMEFCRQEYWSGLPLPPPGDLANPGVELESPDLQVDFFLLFFLPSELPGTVDFKQGLLTKKFAEK